jgi:hypothetical protein
MYKIQFLWGHGLEVNVRFGRTHQFLMPEMCCRNLVDNIHPDGNIKKESWWMRLLRAFVPHFEAMPYLVPYNSHEETEYYTRVGHQGALYYPASHPTLCTSCVEPAGAILVLRFLIFHCIHPKYRILYLQSMTSTIDFGVLKDSWTQSTVISMHGTAIRPWHF